MKSKIRTLRSIALLMFAVSLFTCLSGAQDDKQSPPTQHSMGSRKNAVGLPNFGEVSPQLYRGGQPGIDGFETLKGMGVSIVVDMRAGHNQHEKGAVTKLGMKYVSIPWHCPMPKDEPFAKFLKVIQDNPGQKIFVHCRLGDDRTGMAVASYRMAEEGWSAEEAMKEMELFGFTGVHHAICPTLAEYEKHFPEHWKTHDVFKDLRPSGSAVPAK